MSSDPPPIDFASLLGPRDERPRVPLTLVTIIALAAAVAVLAVLLYVVLPREGTAGATAFGIELALGCIALASVAVVLRHEARHARTVRALAAEAAFRRAMESSLAAGLHVVDPRGVIRYVNRAFCRMTGFTADELVDRVPPYPYWPPAQRDAHEDRLRQILAGHGEPGGFEIAVQRRDGTTFDARMDVSPLIDDAGRHLGWMTSMADVTEPRRIRNQLAASHDRFTTVLESLQAAVSVVAAGAHGGDEVLFANREYRDRLGDGPAGHLRLARRLRGAADEPAAEVLDEPTGRWFDVRERAIRWPAFLGDLEGLPARLQIASDITLRKSTEEAARRHQEKVHFTSRLMTLGEMASSLAHELNQPLTAIANYSEGLLARLKAGDLPADAINDTLQRTSAQAQRAGRIIRRIREFVKRSEPDRQAVAAARVLDNAIGFAEIAAARKRIAIVADVAPDLPPLDVDPVLIEQVLLNLLNNAIDAMDGAAVRRIDVQVRRADAGTAEFRVIDRGSGIAPEDLGNLFQPFFSTKPDGMGMGLNICRSIVEYHHGRLTVEPNPEPAGGTVFRFTAALAAPLEASSPPQPAQETARR